MICSGKSFEFIRPSRFGDLNYVHCIVLVGFKCNIRVSLFKRPGTILGVSRTIFSISFFKMGTVKKLYSNDFQGIGLSFWFQKCGKFCGHVCRFLDFFLKIGIFEGAKKRKFGDWLFFSNYVSIFEYSVFPPQNFLSVAVISS